MTNRFTQLFFNLSPTNQTPVAFVYNEGSNTIVIQYKILEGSDYLGRHGLPVAERRERVSPLLLLLIRGRPSPSLSTQRT